MTVLQPGDTIDIWVIEAALGSGGMGSVYRCHNKAATRILAAVKVLEGGLKRYPEAEARFIREAEILYQLDHPNIVKVRNIRVDADPPYLEMEFVAGESLDERMRRGPLTFHESVQCMRQVAEALAYLHGKQIRHRDIKPANLVLQKDGRLKLVDFGLAVEADTTRITQQGMAFGTVSYAPPEWITPDQLDPSKWDIYALGVVFYELLTGELAFPVSGQGTARQQAMQVIVAKQDHPPLDPGEGFHDDVRRLIMDMTAADASRRIGEAEEVVRRMLVLHPTPKRGTGVTLAPTADQSLIFTRDSDATDTWEATVTGPVPQGPPKPPVQRALRGSVQTTTPVTMPVPVRVGRVVLAFGGVGALMLAVLLGTGVALAGVGWWITRPPPAPSGRELVVELEGLPAGAEADLVSTAGVPARDGSRYTFAAVAPGPVDIRWALGSGCTVTACNDPATCAPWCETGVARVDVPEGTEPLVHPVALPAPAPRDVSLRLSGPTDGLLSAKLLVTGTAPVAIAAEATPELLVFRGVPPGRHRLELTLGTCDAAALECGATCPPGCRSVVDTIEVPRRGEPSPAVLAVAPPEAVPAPAVPPGVPRAPRSELVSMRRMAEWLETHPDWAPGGPFAVTDRYLTWWSNGDRDSTRPATAFTPKLADSYCRDLGRRLPAVDAEPHEPPEGTLELRLAERSFVMIELDGAGRVRSVPAAANAAVPNIAVFRCVK